MERVGDPSLHASVCRLYRLAYAAKPPDGAAGAAAAASRLPVTAAFELLAPGGDAPSCRRLAQAWSRAAALSGPALHADPHRDRAAAAQPGACPPAAVCNTSPVGAPARWHRGQVALVNDA